MFYFYVSVIASSLDGTVGQNVEPLGKINGRLESFFANQIGWLEFVLGDYTD